MFTKRNLIALAAGVALSAGLLPQAVAAQTALEEVKARGVFRVGMAAADPWFYKNPATNEWTGVGVEIGKLMAAELGLTFQPVETTWGNSVAALQAGQIDVMYVLDPTEERKKAIDFPDTPLFYYAMGALTKEGVKVENWQDLNKAGTRVGVTLGTTVDRRLTEQLPNATIERFASNDESVAAFAAGRVDVVSQFHPALIVQSSRLRMGVVQLPKETVAVPTSVGLRKAADPSFRDWIDGFIAKIYNDGTTNKIFRDYIATKGINPDSVPGIQKETWF